MLEQVRATVARDAVDWGEVEFYWGDERFLPPGDPERNETQAREALLDHIRVDPAKVYPMGADQGTGPAGAEAAAEEYAALLASKAQPEDHGPVPDVRRPAARHGRRGAHGVGVPALPRGVRDRALGRRRARLPEAAAHARLADPARHPQGGRGVDHHDRRLEGGRGGARAGRRGRGGDPGGRGPRAGGAPGGCSTGPRRRSCRATSSRTSPDGVPPTSGTSSSTAANVVGSRPTAGGATGPVRPPGWPTGWSRRSKRARSTPTSVHLVLEGAAKAADVRHHSRLERRPGDRRRGQRDRRPGRGPSRPAVTVVTADRGLRARLPKGEVVGPSELLRHLRPGPSVS